MAGAASGPEPSAARVTPAPVRRLMPAVVAVAVGAAIAVQSRVNAELATRVGSGLEAAVVSFGSGLLLLCVAIAAVPRLRSGVPRLAAEVAGGRVRWWQLVGGLAGAWFVATQGMAVPLVGVAVFTVGFVAGQTASALLVDRAGLGPAGRRPVTGLRVAAAGLAVVAVAVAVSDRVGGGAASWWPALLAVSAGVGNAAQQAVNGRVAVAAREPLVAAGVNFLVGTAALVVAFGLGAVAGWVVVTPLPAGPWWLYAGGAVGVVFIAGAAWVVRPLGVLLFALFSILGQLGVALLLDLWAPTPGAALGWQLVAGAALAGVAVVVAGVRR